MEYPKQLMSIEELSSMGYPKRWLKDQCHIRGFPARRTSERGKWLIDTAALEDWFHRHKLNNAQKKML